MQRMRFKYRISIMNENTLEESWRTHLSRFNVLIFIVSFFIITFILLTLLIFATPLRYYLPGYQDSGNRLTIIQQSLKFDSLEREMNLMNAYLVVLKENIEGNFENREKHALDTVTFKQIASDVLEKTSREAEFVKKYEETEKYNLSAVLSSESEKMYVFFRPVDGVIASTFKPKEGEFGIKIITSPLETVKSIQEGRVIFTGYTFDNEWVIQLLHDNNYISIYKNNQRLMKSTGDYVKAGESIAVTGDKSANSASKYFYFEIWKNGNPINPQEVITFRE